MYLGKRANLAGLVVIVALLGCAPSQTARQPEGGGGQPPAPATPKRAVATVLGEPFALNYQISSAGAYTPPGSEALEELVHSGLTTLDPKGALIPRLAEAVPTLENGMWKVFPDGRMETTWRIRPNAQWHDGAAFTPDDLVFTAAVWQDPDLPAFAHAALRSV